MQIAKDVLKDHQNSKTFSKFEVEQPPTYLYFLRIGIGH